MQKKSLFIQGLCIALSLSLSKMLNVNVMLLKHGSDCEFDTFFFFFCFHSNYAILSAYLQIYLDFIQMRV